VNWTPRYLKGCLGSWKVAGAPWTVVRSSTCFRRVALYGSLGDVLCLAPVASVLPGVHMEASPISKLGNFVSLSL
jgi:hypothetical protein